MPLVCPWKIAVVVPKYGLVGGGERFVFELTERLATYPDYEIHVFANQWRVGTERITFHRVPVVTFPKWLGPLGFAWFVNRKIASIGGFDLIHSHERILRADVCSMHFVPHRFWISQIRRKRFMSLFDRATCWVEKQMLGGQAPCRAVLPVSSLAREQLLAEYELPGSLVEVIHPGVNGELFQAENLRQRQDGRQEFGIADQEFLILFVAMNFELKGLDLLLAAVSQLKNQGRNGVKILVVGSGNEKKFQLLAGQLGVEDDVRFAGVRLDMERMYHSGDLLALLSGFDTFGMVVTEAMASGLPVIVSHQVGAKDLIRDGENGFVVERTAIDLIAERLALIMDDSDRYLAMQRMAQKTAALLSWDLVTARVAGIYEKLLNGR